MADVCTFYSKIGACRHGDKCSRRHIHPRRSDTILIFNLYRNPKGSSQQIQQRFDQFYQDVFVYIARIGEIDAMVVCENDNDHLNGNVYVKFMNDTVAETVMNALNEEWYDALPIHCELSPVESFQDANCRAYDAGACSRGGHCNFMHIRRPTPEVKSVLHQAQDKWKVEKALEKVAPDDPLVVAMRERVKAYEEREARRKESEKKVTQESEKRVTEEREKRVTEENEKKRVTEENEKVKRVKSEESEKVLKIQETKIESNGHGEDKSTDNSKITKNEVGTNSQSTSAPADGLSITTTSAVEKLFSRR